MPPRNEYRRPPRGKKGGWIALGILSLLYSESFPLYRLADYLVLGGLGYLTVKAVRAIARKVHEKEDEAAEKAELERLRAEKAEREAREKQEQERKAEEARKAAERARSMTGKPEVDAMILRGQQLLQQIRSENARLPEPEITAQIDAIESVANQIFKAVLEQPDKANQIRRFMDYYLPTTLKMLVAYRRMEENRVTGENANDARRRIRESLDMVIEAFNKQLSQLYENDTMDINTDIDVMQKMLKQDGLIDSGLRVRTSTGEEKRI